MARVLNGKWRDWREGLTFPLTKCTEGQIPSLNLWTQTRACAARSMPLLHEFIVHTRNTLLFRRGSEVVRRRINIH